MNTQSYYSDIRTLTCLAHGQLLHDITYLSDKVHRACTVVAKIVCN
jgi:hypothetical protein